MKLHFKPSFSTYFCLQLILQFCSTYCDVGNCASIRLNSGDNSETDSDDRILNTVRSKATHESQQVAKLDQHLRETLGNDPFVYNWFKEHPKYMVDLILREVFKNSVNNEELLNAFLNGMFNQPYLPNRLPKEFAGLSNLSAVQHEDSADSPTELVQATTLDDPEADRRDLGSIVDICSVARVRDAERAVGSTIPADYSEIGSPEDGFVDVPPPGCYFYTGDETYPNYLVCDDEDITEVPSDIPVMLDVFEMNRTSVECIRPQAFRDVRVHYMRLSWNKIQGIAPDAFEGVRELEHLFLSHNFIRMPIWFTSVAGLEDIEGIEMENNKINMNALAAVGNGQLFREIEARNSIHSDGPFFTKVKYIVLSNNREMGFIPSFFFNRFTGANWVAITISLVNCGLDHIHPDAFVPFKSIWLLELSENPELRHNLVEAATAMSKANVKKLNLAHNSMSSVPTEALALIEGSLIGLDLRGNSFITLNDDSFPLMPKLTAINLENCRISEISKRAFVNLPNLDTLVLKANSLVTIPAALGPLVKLNTLVMSENRNPANNQFIIGSKAFATLTKLKVLHLNELRLLRLNSSSFEGLGKLNMLHMVNSRLQTLEDGIFKETNTLLILDISNNPELTGINAKTFQGLENLDSLYMKECALSFPTSPRGEPSNRNLTSRYHKHDPERDSEPRDDEPEERNQIVQNATVDFVSVGQLLKNSLNEDEEDDDEFSKTREPFRYLKRLRYLMLNDNKVARLYPELFKNMPYLRFLDLNKNTIQAWSERVFEKNPALGELRLSGNQFLTTSDAMLEDFTDVYTRIDLTENPYSCDIGICNLKSAVANRSFYLHEWTTSPSRYLCYKGSDRVRIDSLTIKYCEELDLTTVNPGPEPTTIGNEGDDDTTTTTTDPSGRSDDLGESGGSFNVKTLLIVAACLIVAAGCGAVFYKKRLHLKYFWFDFKLNLIKGKGGKDSKLIRADSTSNNIPEYDFDVFISYSHLDSNFIQEHVVPVLEGKGKFLLNDKTATSTIIPEVFNPVLKERKLSIHDSTAWTDSNSKDSNEDWDGHSFKVCLHERDFEVGTSITENIVESVDRSRKVVIVVSRNYLESQWCLFEMNLAYHRLIEVRRKSFVVILLEEVPAELRTKVLNYLMKSTTYLQWPGDKASAVEKKTFWTRLRHSLKTTV